MRDVLRFWLILSFSQRPTQRPTVIAPTGTNILSDGCFETPDIGISNSATYTTGKNLGSWIVSRSSIKQVKEDDDSD